MDVIALHQAGFASVAPLGTALTGPAERALGARAATPALPGWRCSRPLRALRGGERALPLLEPGRTSSWYTCLKTKTQTASSAPRAPPPLPHCSKTRTR